MELLLPRSPIRTRNPRNHIVRVTFCNQHGLKRARVNPRASIIAITSASLESLIPICLENRSNTSPLLLQRTRPIPTGLGLPSSCSITINFSRPLGGESQYYVVFSLDGQQNIHASHLWRMLSYSNIKLLPFYGPFHHSQKKF